MLYISVWRGLGLSYVRHLSHLCTLLEPFYGFRYPLTGTLAGPQCHIVRNENLCPQGEGAI